MNKWSIEEEARQAIELVQVYCDTCRDYHLARSFLKAAGWERGPARDRALFAPMLRRFAFPGARVLIAGAADTGLLDFAVSAIGDLRPEFVVADKCRTPLVLCERYAASEEVVVRTVEADLIRDHVGTFDLIIGHLVLSFVPPAERIGFLQHLGTMLAPSGTLVLGAGKPRTGPRVTPMTLTQVLAALRVRGLQLPGDGQMVTDALRWHVDQPAPHLADPVDTRPFETLCAEAGLDVVERWDTATDLPVPGDPKLSTRLYFAARRLPDTTMLRLQGFP
jgi:hypothetical protein